MSSLDVVLFIAGTVCIAAFTWRFSVKAGRYHGVYRFFSFECILILLLLQWRVWFDDPLSWHQIISWMMLAGSIVPAVEGFRLLRAVGKPEGQFEATTHLVVEGMYRTIRHPLYASLMLLGLGIFFKQMTWPGAILTLVNGLAVFGTAKQEEREMIVKFGLEYLNYMKHSKMFIPYVF
jgi:protein-S-isoprenylcysteine O-methyltransferase Ste14